MGRGVAEVSSRQSRPGTRQVNYRIEVLLQSRTSRPGQMTTASYSFFLIFSRGNLAGNFVFLVLRADDCIIVPSGDDCGFCFRAMRVPTYIHGNRRQ